MELAVNLTTRVATVVDTTEFLLSSMYSELLARDDISLGFGLHILQGRNSATCNRRLLKTAGFSSEDRERSRGGHTE